MLLSYSKKMLLSKLVTYLKQYIKIETIPSTVFISRYEIL